MKDYLEKRREELRKRDGGFTLMEMLIVVAIIAVLIAIAIPVFTTQLELSRESTDLANIRSAYAECSAALLVASDDDANDVTYTEANGTNPAQASKSGIPIKQVVSGWETSGDVEIAGITVDDLPDVVSDNTVTVTVFGNGDDWTVTVDA